MVRWRKLSHTKQQKHHFPNLCLTYPSIDASLHSVACHTNKAGRENLMCSKTRDEKSHTQNGLNSCRRWNLSRPKTTHSRFRENKRKMEKTTIRRIGFRGGEVNSSGVCMSCVRVWFILIVDDTVTSIQTTTQPLQSNQTLNYSYSFTLVVVAKRWKLFGSRHPKSFCTFWVSVCAKRVSREKLNLILVLLSGADFEEEFSFFSVSSALYIH